MDLSVLKRYALVFSFCAISLTSFAADYYVATDGSDTADGSEGSPFKTLAKAAGIAVAGDTVIIREGTYEETLRPANSGTSGKPIVFRSFDGEKVIITAMQSLSGWAKDSGAVYSTSVDWDLGQENFVMQGATAMDLARWPNNDGDPFTSNSLRNTGGSASSIAQDAFLDYSPGIPDFDWSKGGSLYFYGDKPGSGWLTWRAFITSSTQTRVNVDLSDKKPDWIRTFHAPGDQGDFFLQGIREALDYQNEWYFDKDTMTLFVQLPNDAEPVDGQVKMRRRKVTVDLSGRNYIEVRNLAVFGGSIELTDNASNNLISRVSSFYGNFTLGVFRSFAAPSYSVNITHNSTDNTIDRSEIAFGAGSGIRDAGTGTKILNSYIHDFDYLGDYNAAILAREGKNTTIKNNHITRAGRSVIQLINENSIVAYNDISHCTLIADDSALLYTLGGPRNISIHHNWFHDAQSSGSKRKAAGVYLDNDSKGFSVHHNVIWNTEWTAVQINWSGTDLDIFNNTMWNNTGGTVGAWHKAGTAFSNVKMWNNLSQKPFNDPQINFDTNVNQTNSPFVDLAKNNFALTAGSTPADAGQVIAGITDDVTDASPDVGAYEVGGRNADWVPGVSWDRSVGPLNLCYQLPGEVCVETTLPTVTASDNLAVKEGNTATVLLTLSGYPKQYPLTIPYTVSGTASDADHDAKSGDVIIASGLQGEIVVRLMEDSEREDDETVVFSFGKPTNAELGWSFPGASLATNVIIVDSSPATPTPSPTPTPSATPSPEPTPTPEPTSEQTPTPEPASSGGSSGGGSTDTSLWILMVSALWFRRRIVHRLKS